jgi:hypothetical protein
MKTVSEMVNGLAAYFKEENKMVIQLTIAYLESREVSISDLFSKIVENEKFFPRIVDIKKYLNVVDHYQSAIGAAQKFGAWHSVYFFDDRIAQTIRIGWGSWTGFCLSTDKNRGDRFRAIYDTTAASKQPSAGLLAGDPGEEIYGIENGEKGDRIAEKINFCIQRKVHKDFPIYKMPELITDNSEPTIQINGKDLFKLKKMEDYIKINGEK